MCEAFESKQLPSSASFSIPPLSQARSHVYWQRCRTLLCLHTSIRGKFFLKGITQDRLMQLQLTSEEMWVVHVLAVLTELARVGAPAGI